MHDKKFQQQVETILKNSDSGGIRRIGIPTRNRTKELKRLLEQLTKESSKFDGIEIIVVDQSDEKIGVKNKKTCVDLAKKNGVTIFYLGKKEQLAYVDALAKQSGFRYSLLYHMLIGEENDITIGAARNLLLLLSSGQASMQVDDDIELKLYYSEKKVDKSMVKHTSRQPQTVYAYPSYESVFNDIGQLIEDPLSLLLDQQLNTFTQTSNEAIEDGNKYYHQKLMNQSSVVAMVMPGVAGDTPISRNHFLSIEPDNQHPFFKLSAKEYETHRQSAFVAIQPSSLTLTNHNYCITACVLFPTPHQLPPFPPTKRASDNTFGFLMATTYPDYLIAHIPYVLTHTRELVKDQINPHTYLGVSNNYMLTNTLMRTPVMADSRNRLNDVGTFLFHFSQCQIDEFIKNVQSISRISVEASLHTLEERVSNNSWTPRYWQDDINNFITQMRHLASERRFTSEANWQKLNQEYRAYAQILMHWSDIWNSAQIINKNQWLVENIPYKKM